MSGHVATLHHHETLSEAILSRLVELEGDQASLLADVLTLPTIDVAALTDTGVDWPATARDRKPDYSARQSEITLDL